MRESSTPDQASSKPDTRIGQLYRRLRVVIWHWRRRPYSGIDHDEVMEHVGQEGRISVRYGILTLLSCGIAILGLLQSSPAVVIGAMLISPLMGPITLFGFSLATLDHHLVLKSLKAIGFGIALAVLQAALIVWLSPLTTVTAEILARTRPNFFDLLVAVFSGVAGAYAVAHRKGETIVGVAIATALMPPLAVVGYGLAVGNWAIFSGATGLFMTNLLAIGLTASLVARFFGFGATHPKHHKTLHTVGIFAVFAILSIPLGLSLRQIAHEAILSAKAKTALGAYFAPQGGHIYGMEIRFPDERPIEIDALVLTEKLRVGAENEIRRILRRELARPISLSLSQVPVRTHESFDRQAVSEMIGKSTASLFHRLRPQPDIAREAALAAQLPPLAVAADPHAKTALISATAPTPSRLAMLRGAQRDLSRRFTEWRFQIRIDTSALPPIPFAEGETEPDEAGARLIEDIAWALRESAIMRVKLVGHSDSSRRTVSGRRMAQKRAEAVAARLKDAGITASLEAQYPASNQRAEEREKGRAYFRNVTVLPVD